MKTVPGKGLSQWWDIGHGGETCFHTDFIVEAGETVLDVLTRILSSNLSLSVQLRGDSTVHFALSVGREEGQSGELRWNKEVELCAGLSSQQTITLGI